MEKLEQRIGKTLVWFFLGQGLVHVTLAGWITLNTVWAYTIRPDPVVVSTLLLISLAPGILISPLAGLLADARKHQMLLLVLVVLLAALSVCLPRPFMQSWRLPALYQSTGLASVCSGIFVPLKFTIVQGLRTGKEQEKVQERVLFWTNALSTTGFVVGSSFTPIIFFLVGPIWSCLVMSSCLVLAVVCFICMRRPGASGESASAALSQEEPVVLSVKEVVAGGKIILANRTLILIVLTLACEAIGSSIFNALHLVFVITALHAFSWYGVINAIMGGCHSLVPSSPVSCFRVFHRAGSLSLAFLDLDWVSLPIPGRRTSGMLLDG